MTMELGIDFDQLEKEVRPPLVPDGIYDFQIADVTDSPVQQSGRPQWRFRLQIINRPDLPNRSLFVYAQLPWIDPDKKDWDYSNCFSIVDIVNGADMQVTQPNPDPSGQTFYGIPMEMFKGRTGQMKVTHKPRKDEPETIDNVTRIVTKKKGGSTVA